MLDVDPDGHGRSLYQSRSAHVDAEGRSTRSAAAAALTALPISQTSVMGPDATGHGRDRLGPLHDALEVDVAHETHLPRVRSFTGSIPTSTAITPSRTIPPVTSPATPAATMRMSACPVNDPRSSVREWHVTTVAFRWSPSDAAGFPTELWIGRRRRGSCRRTPSAGLARSSEGTNPGGRSTTPGSRARTGASVRQQAGVLGAPPRRPCRGPVPGTRAARDARGKRPHEDAGDTRVGVQLPDDRQDVGELGIHGQARSVYSQPRRSARRRTCRSYAAAASSHRRASSPARAPNRASSAARALRDVLDSSSASALPSITVAPMPPPAVSDPAVAGTRPRR